jgi:hypothetical protein
MVPECREFRRTGKHCSIRLKPEKEAMMSDPMNKPLSELKDDILRDGIVDANEAATLRERLFADGRIDREEADLLFEINDAVSGKANDPAWQKLFVNALTLHVLSDEATPGAVDADETAYLKGRIQSDGKVDAAELALLVNIVAKAKTTTEEFQQFVLACLKAAILADGVIDETEVGQIRTVIYGSGGGGGQKVDRAEAEFLFELNDATSGKANHAAWNALFVEAVASSLLEDEVSPGVVDASEAAWLCEKIAGDGRVDENEKALLGHIKAHAREIAPVLKDLMGSLGI